MLVSMNSLVAMSSGLSPDLGGWFWAVKIGVTISIIRCSRALSKLPRVWSDPFLTKSERIFSMA